MSNLYDFSKNAWHVKFYKWVWDVDPTWKFKTMCPYFWRSFGTMLILPLILLWKLGVVVLSPIDRWMDIRVDNIIADLEYRMNNAYTDEDFYNLYSSKCWKKYKDDLRRLLRRGGDDLEKFNEVYNRGYWYERPIKPKNESFQKVTDTIVYGWIGKVLGSIIILGLFSLLGWGVYGFVHLFTMEQFINFCKNIGILILVATVFVGLCFGIVHLFKRVGRGVLCNTKLGQVVFWTPLGNAIGYGFLFIIHLIRDGVVMTFDMIKNFYNNQCPVITWKDKS